MQQDGSLGVSPGVGMREGADSMCSGKMKNPITSEIALYAPSA